jgi:DNA-binding transcriptional regulator YdaS (Cro superfamily)
MKVNALISKFGSAANLARIAGVSRQAVSQWDDDLPADRVLSVSRATAWQVTPHQLRPDIYPNPTDGLPPDVAAQQKAAA